jgi:drug/metabolite transporter (DMT)-like permease
VGKSAGRLPPNVEGALWMLLSSVTFVAMTTLIKYLGEDYPPALQNFYRQFASVLVILPFLMRDPVRTLRTNRPGALLTRAVTGTLGMILMFYSYQRLPMADANALSFTRPLWVTLLAALILRETLGPHRIAAVAVGFAGVLIILRPGGEHMAYGLPQAAALGSSLLLAFSITGMKSLTRDHSAFSVLAWSALLGLLMSVPFAIAVWRWPSPGDLVLLFMMGAMGVINQTVFIRGMSVGDAAAMAPLDYTRLLLSIASGFLLFSEVPDLMTLAGALVIVVSTLYMTVREVRMARRERAEARAAPPVAEL